MSETTPTTQEPQQPLSLVDHLRLLLAETKAQRAQAEGAVKGYRSLANLDDEGHHTIASWEDCAKRMEERATALEQTVAILQTLANAGPLTLDELTYLRSEDGFCRVIDANRRRRIFIGRTVLDALLKAHEALKPQEGAGPRKEQSNADTV